MQKWKSHVRKVNADGESHVRQAGLSIDNGKYVTSHKISAERGKHDMSGTDRKGKATHFTQEQKLDSTIRNTSGKDRKEKATYFT